jgi:hypothetical protein
MVDEDDTVAADEDVGTAQSNTVAKRARVAMRKFCESEFIPLTTAKLKEAISEGERQKLRVRVCLDERDLTDMAADAVASMLADCKRTHLDETVTLADLPRERRNNLETMAIPDAQWAALNATFDEIDVDGSGTITVDELHTALQDRSTELSKLDMDTLWREINVGAKVLTPAIDFPGFCKFAHSPNLGVRRAAQDRARRDNYWLRHAQPAPGEDHLWVDIRFVLFKLTNVDTVGGSAFVKLSLFSYWNDPRVKGWDGPLPEKLWGPAFNLSNSLGDLIVTEDEFELLDRSTGRLKRAFIYEGKVDNPMDLRAFPCDLDDVSVNSFLFHLSTFPIHMIILPRQARDKHKRKFTKKPVSHAGDVHYAEPLAEQRRHCERQIAERQIVPRKEDSGRVRGQVAAAGPLPNDPRVFAARDQQSDRGEGTE